MKSFSVDDREYKTFVVRYRYEGAEWGFQIPARDYEDAKARLTHLQYATIDGELVVTLPASIGPLASLIAGFRNALRLLAQPR